MMKHVVLSLLVAICACTDKKQANNMTLDELLQKQRNQYMQMYKAGVVQHKTEKSAIEVALQVTADQNSAIPEVYQIYRYDLINTDTDGKLNPIEFNLDVDSILKYDEHVFEFNGMQVNISPFIWNGCELSMDRKPNISYESWVRRWLDIGDKKKVNNEGFQNVIHSATYPSEDGDKWKTSIDFGSASIEAFKELMNTLSKQGINEVKIHSKAFAD